MKIAIVTPWFSDSTSGGAERFAGGIAKCLQDAGCQVEILTTCGKDSFWDWGKNYFNEETTTINGILTRRFSLRKRNKELYEEILGKLINEHKLTYAEEMQLMHETVNSDSLFDYISEHSDEYIFMFIPYLFGTSYWGGRIKPENSFLVPCVHDEDMAYFNTVGDLFNRVSGLFFNTVEEQEFTHELHGIPLDDTVVSGGGVEMNYEPDENLFREKYGITGDYFVYVGRQVTGKNVPQLIHFFDEYIKESNSEIKLLFIGQGENHVIEAMKPCPNIKHIGEVSDQDKYNAIAGARALIQPSLMESFSIVIMESWLCETPVIVHELCPVTKGHCLRSNGGLYYKDYPSFKRTVEYYIDHKVESVEMGSNGRQYVEENYRWSNTAEKMLNFFIKKGFKKEDLIYENTH
jgi:glycosyltransferase involved in cell wall biosynthesis